MDTQTPIAWERLYKISVLREEVRRVAASLARYRFCASRFATPQYYVEIFYENERAAASLGEDPYRYFLRMAERGIFWEMNVSYDSIHNYYEHPYMLEFFKNPEQQAIVRESGVCLSVGFDGHRVEDYFSKRIADYCKRIEGMGIQLAFDK